MKRTLILVRHAKSDWSTAGQADFDRPLNERGKRDAPEMGGRLKAKGLQPDLILASPAKRAASTARLVAGALGYDAGNIRWIDRLYHCPASVFEDVILESDIDDSVATLFIFAHNPGITNFANETAPELDVDNIPTCGMVAVTFDADHWSDFVTAPHTLLFFDYPKNQ
ncbi:SixA phosphatase family protein [Taibaiella koreensis]|uniref:SixA phosphatase family protein n=1 Tax=Taibaiella koreensis TaxID=1268548 RepID=UPI000E599FC2|nr:histidine phosphatase family protein [Taibaiella koreensis]